MRKFWIWLFVLSLSVILACGIVTYMRMTINAFQTGRYVLGVFLTALFTAAFACIAAAGMKQPKKKETRDQVSDNEC